MKETNNLESFIIQLEIAMKSGGIDRGKWKHYMLTQLTVKAKEPIVALLENYTANYDNVKEALLT